MPQAKQILIEDNATDDCTYIGKAYSGVAEDASLWQLRRIKTISGVEKIQYGNGVKTYMHKWEDREEGVGEDITWE